VWVDDEAPWLRLLLLSKLAVPHSRTPATAL
jgi:hypothetical protein